MSLGRCYYCKEKIRHGEEYRQVEFGPPAKMVDGKMTVEVGDSVSYRKALVHKKCDHVPKGEHPEYKRA